MLLKSVEVEREEDIGRYSILECNEVEEVYIADAGQKGDTRSEVGKVGE